MRIKDKERISIEGCLVKYNSPWFNGITILPGALDKRVSDQIPIIYDYGSSLATHNAIVGYIDLEYLEDGIYYKGIIYNKRPREHLAIDCLGEGDQHIGLVANKIEFDDKNKKVVKSGELQYAFICNKEDDASEILKVDDMPYTDFCMKYFGERLIRQAGWISVDEKLPPKDQSVLVTDGDGYAVGFWREDAKALDNTNFGWLERQSEDEHPIRLGKVIYWKSFKLFPRVE